MKNKYQNYIDDNGNQITIDTDYLGNKRYYKNNLLHRDDNLPAIEYADGETQWYKEGKLHRLDGPAREWYRWIKYKEWWVEGKYICNTTQEEFERLINLQLFW